MKDQGLKETNKLPEGMVLAPHYRGYACMGAGQYLLSPSDDDGVPCLIISIATDEDKAGRQVGDLRPSREPGKPIQPEDMAVRLDFVSERGLFALEDILRVLREEYFPIAAGGSIAYDQRTYLDQAQEMLEDYATVLESGGNDSAAMGAKSSAHVIRQMLARQHTKEQ